MVIGLTLENTFFGWTGSRSAVFKNNSNEDKILINSPSVISLSLSYGVRRTSAGTGLGSLVYVQRIYRGGSIRHQ